MIVNKWLMFALAALGVIVPDLAALPWANIVSAATAADINMVAGVLMVVIHALAPPASQTNVVSTGGSIVTHT